MIGPAADAEVRAHRPSASPAIALTVVGVASAGIAAYVVVRALALASTGRAHRHAEWLLRIEGSIGFDVERGVQSLLLRHDGIIGFLNAWYSLGFWPLLLVAAVVLLRTDRPAAARFGAAVLVSGGIGLAVFAAFPVAPPRLLDGFVDTLSRSDSLGVARPAGLANPYAALPSFHVGWVTLAGVVLGAGRAGAVRAVLLLPAGLMTVAVVATGNHFVIDAVAGVVVVLASLGVVHRLEPVVIEATGGRAQRHDHRLDTWTGGSTSSCSGRAC